MVQGIGKFKPGVARRVHIFSAALLWTFIGGLLLYRGFSYLLPGGEIWPVVLGIAAGTVKSYLILDRSARKGLERIGKFSDKTCIGAVYSWKTWLLVLIMMLAGFLIRGLSLPPAVTGTICLAIGWALVFSSRHAWSRWASWNAKE